MSRGRWKFIAGWVVIIGGCLLFWGIIAVIVAAVAR